MRLRIREERRAMPAYEKPPAWRVDVYCFCHFHQTLSSNFVQYFRKKIWRIFRFLSYIYESIFSKEISCIVIWTSIDWTDVKCYIVFNKLQKFCFIENWEYSKNNSKRTMEEVCITRYVQYGKRHKNVYGYFIPISERVCVGDDNMLCCFYRHTAFSYHKKK